MTDHPLTNPDLTRRALVASAVAGTLAAGSEPAAAQRCMGPPPPHVKGPAVWLDLDQQELDDAYDQDVYAFNARNIADMIADPRDLEIGRTPGPASGHIGASAVDRLYNDKAKVPQGQSTGSTSN